MSTQIWAYPSLEHLPAGRVVIDRRGLTALHMGTDQWLVTRDDLPFMFFPTMCLALPVTIQPATKEVTT